MKSIGTILVVAMFVMSSLTISGAAAIAYDPESK